MRRRSKSKQADRGRQKPKPKGCTTSNLSIAGLQEQVTALTQELKEALALLFNPATDAAGPILYAVYSSGPVKWISKMSNMLSPLMIGLLVFVLILTGTFVGRSVRRLLPRDDLTDETKSLVSVSMAVVSTISALVLGLLISN
ncbi:MAG: hypothetical protein WAO13_15800, partial [Pseudolabrys sp.]